MDLDKDMSTVGRDTRLPTMMGSQPTHPVTRHDFRVAIFCALTFDASLVRATFDRHWDYDRMRHDEPAGDSNVYSIGTMGSHNVVLVELHDLGKAYTAVAARNCRRSFPNVKLALSVGTGQVVPFGQRGEEIILGDVIISDEIIELDVNEQRVNAPETTEADGRIRLLRARLQTTQGRASLSNGMTRHLRELQLYRHIEIEYPGTAYDELIGLEHCGTDHGETSGQPDCDGYVIVRRRLQDAMMPSPAIHFGPIASTSSVKSMGVLVKNYPDTIETSDALAIDISAIAIRDTFEWVIIRGGDDYIGRYKPQLWERYAAATVASCTKAVLDALEPFSIGEKDNFDVGIEMEITRTEQDVDPRARQTDRVSTLKTRRRLKQTVTFEGYANASRRTPGNWPDSIVSMFHVVLTHGRQKEWREAGTLQTAVTEWISKEVGDEHTSTWECQVTLSIIYRNQNRDKEADELLLRVVEAKARSLGKIRPYRPSTSMVDMALAWKNNSYLQESVRFLDDLILQQERLLGIEEPQYDSVLSRLTKLAKLHEFHPQQTEYSYSTQSEGLLGSSLGTQDHSTAPTTIFPDLAGDEPPHMSSVPMSFYNFQLSEEERVCTTPPDDIQSIASVKDDIQSLDGSQSEVATAAISYTAEMFINDSDLFGLYHEATQRMSQEKFVRNNRRLLKKFYLQLESEVNTAQENIAVDFLRSRNSRTRISHEIHSRLRPWDGTTREKVHASLEQEKDKLFILDRYLEKKDNGKPLAATDSNDLDPRTVPSNDANADNSMSETDGIDETSETSGDSELYIEDAEQPSSLNAIARFITSGQSFDTYKKNLRDFLSTQPNPAAEAMQTDQRSELAPGKPCRNLDKNATKMLIKLQKLIVEAIY